MKIAFTIATANYLAQAKTVADSLLKYNPEFKFIIFLLDKNNERFDLSFFYNIDIIEIESVGIDCFNDMNRLYTIFELSNALKPFLAEYIFVKFQEIQIIVYLDSDLMVYDSFSPTIELTFRHNILLTPHLTKPLPEDDLLLKESDFLNTGIYNGGFFALKRSKETLCFLSWWKSHMKSECFVNLSKGLFVDQIWLNLVPIFFKTTFIIENIGLNVAYWNLHERLVSNKNNTYYINDVIPLVFYHFSGYSFQDIDLISKYQTRFQFEQRPDVVKLFKNYHDTVMGNGYERFSKLKCYYTELNEVNKSELTTILYKKESGLEKLLTKGIKLFFK